MNVINCFEVYGHTDTTEGRGPMCVVARFSNYGAAVDFVKSKVYSNWCVMGVQSKSDIENIKETKIVVMDSAGEWGDVKKEQLKAKALAKLTKEECEVLGL